ncbi:MAG: helix-turn-helix domain-containing protein [Lachnospiraceae bacterium]|nr:helix-turn-helix domain-containing protein [Lachnospiraceae bacterium]
MEKITNETIHFNSLSTIFVTDSEGPESYPLHWHNAAEFTLALKDDCHYQVNETGYELHKGDILLVWPQQIHATVKVPKDGALFIQFPASLIENHLDLVSISRLLSRQILICADKNPSLARFISKRILEIKKIHNTADPLSETRCKLCIYEILLKVSEHALKNVSDEPRSMPSYDSGWNYIRAACTYIVENSTEHLTQSDVASQVGLSVFYFSKLFKQYMHMSFPAYLSHIRVKNAASLLLDFDRPITECAFLSGFQSTTAFNKAFHEITGYSPRDYRKMYRQTSPEGSTHPEG